MAAEVGMTIDLLEISASASGLAGATLLALNGRRAGWGFAAFLASNIGWLAFAAAGGHWFMFAQQVGFTITSLIGIWRWLIVPRQAIQWNETGETLPPCDLRTLFLAEQARVIELERQLAATTTNATPTT
jgi:hypothetical protein